jgi:2-iminobutanoate/2-iminopropanoate deaminase
VVRTAGGGRVALLNPSDLPSPSGAFSHGVVAGDMMFVAGQCGLDKQGTAVAPGDAAAQTRRAVENMELVLREGGFELSDVVHVTTFLVDLDDFDAYDRAYADAFGSHRPARATVRADLHSDDLVVEIQAIAKKG